MVEVGRRRGMEREGGGKRINVVIEMKGVDNGKNCER